MKRLITRPRNLVLVAALAVVAATCTVGTAHAASAGSGEVGINSAASLAASASSTPCTINYQSTSCQSTNSTVTVDNYFYGDQSGCTYVSSVSWGDGNSTTNVTNTDPPDGYVFLASHSYTATGTYTISVTSEVTAGDCTANGFTAQFKLLPPAPPPSINKSAHNCLGAAAFPLNDLCVTANYTVLDAHRLKITSVEVCVDILGPAVAAIARPEVNIYSSGRKIWSMIGKPLIYGPFLFDSEKCEWFSPAVIATRGNVGVWGGSAETVWVTTKPDILPEEWVSVSNFR